MYERRIMPFYMTYPLPMFQQKENTVLRDLEYLQQMYPKDAKRYQKIISGILDKLDYEGSMIYDEYPDRIQLYKLYTDILERIKKEEKEEKDLTDAPQVDAEEKWAWIGDLIQVIMYYEIYKRRHNHERFTNIFI